MRIFRQEAHGAVDQAAVNGRYTVLYCFDAGVNTSKDVLRNVLTVYVVWWGIPPSEIAANAPAKQNVRFHNKTAFRLISSADLACLESEHGFQTNTSHYETFSEVCHCQGTRKVSGY